MPFAMVRNDITQMKVDAIVNAANQSLLGGGGVDGAIHRAAGPRLLEECRTLGGCRTGEAKITKGYNLPAKYVVHTVGPIWHGGTHGEEELLTACYRHSLELAVENGCESVAFPMISAGAYGYPHEQAMAVAVNTITGFLMDHDLGDRDLMVYLVVFRRESFLHAKKLFRDIDEYIDDVYAESHINRRREEARRRLWREDKKAALDLDMELSEMNYMGSCEDIRPSATPSLPCMAREEEPCMAAPSPKQAYKADALPSLDELLKKTDAGFSETLMRLIDEKAISDVQCYKKANVDRKLFSKIRSNPDYRPTKQTVCAFAVALELTLPEAEDLLKKAGYALTNSSKFDIVLDYCFRNRIYNIHDINYVLFSHDLPLLGSGMM